MSKKKQPRTPSTQKQLRAVYDAVSARQGLLYTKRWKHEDIAYAAEKEIEQLEEVLRGISDALDKLPTKKKEDAE